MKYLSLALALASTACSQSLVEVLQSQPNLSSLVGLLNSSTVNATALSALTNVTFLAPDNDAIAAFTNSSAATAVAADPMLLQAVLSYHVIQGNYSNITNTSFLATNLQSPYANVTGGQRVEALVGGDNVTFFSGLLQNSTVVNASIPFSGGTIHVIDRLLTVPENVSATGVALNLTAAVGAVQTLNLTQTLDTTPDLTLFLPDNDAFERLGGNLANLSTQDLVGILSYHAVPGLFYSTDLMNGSSVPTVQGSNVTITLEDGDVFVNNAMVITPNVLVANGVVHVIDRLLNPNNATVAPDASTTVDGFPGATSATGVPFTSGVPTPSTSVATEVVTSAVASASSAASSSSSAGAWRPIETGAMGMAALFGGAAAVMNM